MEAERLSGLEVDYQFEFCRPLHRQIGGRGAAQDAIDRRKGKWIRRREQRTTLRATSRTQPEMRRITTKNERLDFKGPRGGLFVADEATRRQLQNLGQRPT